MRWLCFCLLAAALVAAGAVATQLPGGAHADDGPPVSVGGADKFPLRGAASCAAAACHNGNGPPGEKGSEYTTWVVHDPHSHAFEVLYGQRSRQIEKNRQRPDGVSADHPESDPLCLNCHVLNRIEPLAKGGTQVPRRESFGLEDGVSCEACHGAADGWLTQHFTAAWQAKTPEEKQAEGMTNTKDLRTRAELCVRCHVGTGDIDVNHDLIAAGHPRLAFELAGFHAKMPKHWHVRKDMAGRPDFEARLWALGQVESAKAALELLAHRADEKNKKPWPEFAEYDCYACHREIKARNRRQGDDLTTPGALPWGTWYQSLVPGVVGPELRKDVQTGLSELAAQMGNSRPARPDVASRATKLADLLGRQLRETDQRRWDAQGLTTLMRAVAADERQVSARGWDGAAQVYLALAALRAARAGLDPRFASPILTDDLRGMRRALRFPATTTSGTSYDSPRDFSPQDFRQALEKVRRGLND
jgi:hypothetical protein